jgi:hypothetical protein
MVVQHAQVSEFPTFTPQPAETIEEVMGNGSENNQCGAQDNISIQVQS